MTTQLGSWVFNKNDSLSTHERPSEVGCEFLLEIPLWKKNVRQSAETHSLVNNVVHI